MDSPMYLSITCFTPTKLNWGFTGYHYGESARQFILQQYLYHECRMCLRFCSSPITGSWCPYPVWECIHVKNPEVRMLRSREKARSWSATFASHVWNCTIFLGTWLWIACRRGWNGKVHSKGYSNRYCWNSECRQKSFTRILDHNHFNLKCFLSLWN